MKYQNYLNKINRKIRKINSVLEMRRGSDAPHSDAPHSDAPRYNATISFQIYLYTTYISLKNQSHLHQLALEIKNTLSTLSSDLNTRLRKEPNPTLNDVLDTERVSICEKFGILRGYRSTEILINQNNNPILRCKWDKFCSPSDNPELPRLQQSGLIQIMLIC